MRGLQPGDVGFVENHDFTSWWIRFAQHRKYGKNAPEAQYNHVFMVGPTNLDVIEADQTGVAVDSIGRYDHIEVSYVRPPYQDPKAAADAVEAMRQLVGSKYGFMTIASVALALLTGTKLRVGLDGTEICSGSVSYALTRANLNVGEDCEWNTPADLMHYAIQQGWLPA